MKYLLIICLAAFLIFTGCDEQNRCLEPVDTFMVVSVKGSDFSIYRDLIIHGIEGSLTGDTLLSDTLSAQAKRFALPLSLSQNTSGFVMLIGNLRDTLNFHHTMTMQFISENCGFAPEYNIDSVSFSSGIDSVRITDAKVNTRSTGKNVNDQNIIIYFNSAVR